jgi:hypothetical protein
VSGYSIAKKTKDFIGEGVVCAGTVVNGTGLETVEFEESVVYDGKGDEMVDVVVFGCDSCFVALKGI